RLRSRRLPLARRPGDHDHSVVQVHIAIPQSEQLPLPQPRQTGKNDQPTFRAQRCEFLRFEPTEEPRQTFLALRRLDAQHRLVDHVRSIRRTSEHLLHQRKGDLRLSRRTLRQSDLPVLHISSSHLIDISPEKRREVLRGLHSPLERRLPHLLRVPVAPPLEEVAERHSPGVVQLPELLPPLDIDPKALRIALPPERLRPVTPRAVAPANLPALRAARGSVGPHRGHYAPTAGGPSRKRCTAAINSEYRKRREPPGSL